MSASIRPVCALLVHKHPERGGPTVVTAHPIRAADDSQPAMLDSGRILGRDDVDELIGLLRDPNSGTQVSKSFYPPHVLLASPYHLVWFQPAVRSTQFWRRAEGVARIEAVLPPLVFTATRHGLFVVALGSDDYPCEGAAAFHAPLGNVYDHTGVCFGSASIPRTLAPSSIRDWTHVLLGTNYTHVNHKNTLAGGATTDELVAFWKRRERSATAPAKRFLAPTGMTLGQWVERVSELDDNRA